MATVYERDYIDLDDERYWATEALCGDGYDTSDATATAGDILSGKTAYGPNGKMTGTLTPTEKLYWQVF